MTLPARRLPRITLSLLAGLLALPALLLTGCTQGEVTEEEAHERELVAGGRASYRAYCAGCHGLDAKGQGPAAAYMTIPPADLTLITQRHGGTYPEEWVHDRIYGTEAPADTASLDKMLHFGQIWLGENPTPERRQNVERTVEELVSYLESIQAEGGESS